MKKRISVCLTMLSIIMLSLSVQAAVIDSVKEIQHEWAIASYEKQGKEKVTALKQLAEKCEMLTAQYPDSAEMWIWSGIVTSSYAGAKGGLGALGLAKQSRKELERAIAINGDALDGSAYTSLATLFAQVPGWPVGFGDKDKAQSLFERALVINPEGIDSNYFFAQFLLDQGHYAEAEKYYLIAQHAAPRPDRPLADKGRQAEILAGLADTRKKLK